MLRTDNFSEFCDALIQGVQTTIGKAVSLDETQAPAEDPIEEVDDEIAA